VYFSTSYVCLQWLSAPYRQSYIRSTPPHHVSITT